jgi:hypothetical protein
MRAAGIQGASSLTPDLRGRRLKRCLQELVAALPQAAAVD